MPTRELRDPLRHRLTQWACDRDGRPSCAHAVDAQLTLEAGESGTDETHPAFARYTLLRMLGRGNFGKVRALTSLI